MSEKRNINSSTTYATTNILLDLEGVIYNLDKECSFVSQHAEDFLNKNWENKSLQELVLILREEAKCNKQQNVEGCEIIPEGENEDVKQAVFKTLLWQIKSKHYSEGYKKIQKEICADGYKSGNLKVKLCDNVDSILKTWNEEGKKIFVLSSCKIEEINLLLAKTEKGDILPLISGQFDVEVGPKNEKETYSKVLNKIGCTGSDLMFISDKVEYAEAAAYSGLVSLVISKTSTQQDYNITIVNSISDIEFEISNKKRKLTKENVDTQSGQELGKEVIPNDVEMTDISENGITEKEKHSENLECGQGDSLVCKSAEVLTENIPTELGSGDGKQINIKNDSVNNQDQENTPMEVCAMETETNETEHINEGNLEKVEIEESKTVETEDAKIVVEESIKANDLQNFSEKSDDTSVHKTEELKTDTSVEDLDKENKILDSNDVSVSDKNSDEIEKNGPISALPNEEKLMDVEKSTEEKVDQNKSNPDILSVNSATDEVAQEDRVSTQPEQNSVEGDTKTETEKTNADNCKLEANKQEGNINAAIDSDMDTTEKKLTEKESVEEQTDKLSLPEPTSENTEEDKHTDSQKIEPEKSSVELIENQIEGDITNTDKDKNVENVTHSTPETKIESEVVKPEIEEKECNLEVNTNVETGNNELDKSAEDKNNASCLVEAKDDISKDVNPEIGENIVEQSENTANVDETNNVSQSLTSKVLKDEIKTLEAAEDKKIEKPCLSSGQNGMNGNDLHEISELEVNGTVQNGVMKNGKHINGDDLMDVENLPSVEKKQVVEGSVKTGSEIEA